MRRGSAIERTGLVYLELIGPSGVGKTTVASILALYFSGWEVRFRGGIKKRFGKNLLHALRSGARRRCFRELYAYLRERNVSSVVAARRAAAIAGIPAGLSSAGTTKLAVLVDEGPVSYLVGCGGWGGERGKWTTVLRPEYPPAQSFYVVLAASAVQLSQRVEARARAPKRRTRITGKEGISEEQREKGRLFWMERLAAKGAHCLWIETDDKDPKEIAARIYEFVQDALRHGEPGSEVVYAARAGGGQWAATRPSSGGTR